MTDPRTRYNTHRQQTPAFIRDFSVCPRCGAHTGPTPSMNGSPSEFFLRCKDPKCPTYINTYIPQPHQEAVHKDPHRIIGNFGAYGTGKTTTSRQEIIKHLLITPNANVLVGANIAPQYEQTLKRELENDIPKDFLRDYSAQKQYFDLHNNGRVMYRPFDDEDKLRSYNLTMWVGVEASEIKAGAYHQLKTRLRNTAATTPLIDPATGIPIMDYDNRGVGIPRIDKDWRKGIAESNPDAGWILTDILLVSDQIIQHGSLNEIYDQSEYTKDPSISTHIASTDTNRYLPPDFIQENSRNKPAWWVARYLYGSFTYSEGLVYPSAADHVIETFRPPPEWRRMIAFDYGLHNDAVFLFAALDHLKGILYVYKEARTSNANIDTLAELYHTNAADIPSGGLLGQPIADPKSIARRDYNKDSLGDLFIQKGIYFKPGMVSIDARVMRLNAYLEAGKVKIMDCCTGLIREIKAYKFPDRSLNPNAALNKPIDKNNHAINPLEWMVTELPDDPKNIIQGVYNKYGRELTSEPAVNRWLPHALEDDPLPYNNLEDSAFNIAPLHSIF